MCRKKKTSQNNIIERYLSRLYEALLKKNQSTFNFTARRLEAEINQNTLTMFP